MLSIKINGNQEAQTFANNLSVALLNICPALQNQTVRFIDVDSAKITPDQTELGINTYCVDGPYSTSVLNDGETYVMRNATLCSTIFRDESIQHALIAHEYGHIIARISGLHLDKPYSLQEEIFADGIAVSLNLGSSLIFAFNAMSGNNLSSKDELSIRKEIAKLQMANIDCANDKVKKLSTMNTEEFSTALAGMIFNE